MSTLQTPVVDSPTPPKRRGPLALLAGVLFWPRSTFVYLRDFGRWSWVWPVVVVAALALAARTVAIPIERAQAEAILADLQDQVPSDGSEGSVITFSGPAGDPLGAPIGAGAVGNPAVEAMLPVAGVFLDWLFRGAMLLGLAWLFGGRPGFGAMLRMSGWALVPTAARLLVALAVMLIAHRVPTAGLTGLLNPGGALIVNTGAGGSTGDNPGGDVVGPSDSGQPAFVGPGGPTSGPAFTALLQSSLLSSLDIYTIWGLLLTFIGTAVTARLGWLKAVLSTLIYWALSLVLGVLPPLAMSGLLALAGPGGPRPIP